MPPSTEDPVVTSSRREAAVALVLWAVAMAYTVGYSYAFGYGRAAEDVRLIFGIPDWVLWGIFAPWIFWTIVSSLFAKFFMRDARIEEEAADPAGQAGEAAEGNDG